MSIASLEMSTIINAILVTGGAIGLGMATIVTTRQKTARVIETFGKFSSVRTAGLSFKLPWPIQASSKPISLQIQEIAVNVGIKAKDNVFVEMPIRAQFRIDPNNVKDAFYELENPLQQIQAYLVNQVRSSASSKTFDELYSSKDAIEIEAKEALSDRMGEFGFIIENVLVDDPQPSAEVRQSFDKVLASKRLLDAAKNEGEAVKVKSIANAQAEAEALQLRGKAMVEFRKTITEGNAVALKEFTKDTGLSERDALEFIMNVNEMETLTRVGETGGRVVYLSASAKQAGFDLNSAMVNGLPSPNEPARVSRGKSASKKPAAEHQAQEA